MSYDISEILKLSTAEKRQIIIDISETMDDEDISVPDWHIEELERREAMYLANPKPLIPWAEIRKKFEKS